MLFYLSEYVFRWVKPDINLSSFLFPLSVPHSFSLTILLPSLPCSLPHSLPLSSPLFLIPSLSFPRSLPLLTPLSQELKETQNRLVTSTCEAFASSHLKNPTPVFSARSTPLSTSPVSTRPNSVMSGDHMGSRDLLTQRKEDILEEIRRAKALKAFSRRSRFKRWKVSRSISNLSELQESEEDEMYRRARLEKLKFPSEFDINSSYYKLEENAGTVVQLMNKMIRVGKRATWSPDVTWNHSQLSLSESNLNESDAEAGYRVISPESRPLSSLSVEQYQHLVRSRKARADSATSQSSAGESVCTHTSMCHHFIVLARSSPPLSPFSFSSSFSFFLLTDPSILPPPLSSLLLSSLPPPSSPLPLPSPRYCCKGR